MGAAQSQSSGGRAALADLCRVYWYPLYIFARHRGHSPDDAQDLTQRLSLHLLEHRAFSGVDRFKGKFRSFLLVSFQNHLSDAFDLACRLKRRGGKKFVELDAEDAEEWYRRELVEVLTAEKIFDARCAMTVLGEALKKLSQQYAITGKTDTFEAQKASSTLLAARLHPRTMRWRTGIRSAQVAYPSVAKAVHCTFARRGWPHRVRSGGDR
jgi:DNA-directed RNA polymerase specialized sigma24 family protein